MAIELVRKNPPKVPRVAGVPRMGMVTPMVSLPGGSTLTDIATGLNKAALLVSDVGAFLHLFGLGGPSWGIYKDGEPIATWDSVITVDYRHETRIADYPIEQGGFESYNKVQVPYDVRISFASTDGTQGNFIKGAIAGAQTQIAQLTSLFGNRVSSPGMTARTSFLEAMETSLVGSSELELYEVVTPEKKYENANITHISYRRENQRGVSLLVVDVMLQEVRVISTTSVAVGVPDTSNSQSETGKPATSNGTTSSRAVDGPASSGLKGTSTPGGAQPPANDLAQGVGQPMPSVGTSAPIPSTPPPNMPDGPVSVALTAPPTPISSPINGIL